MKVHREFTLATSCAAMLAVNLSGPVFAAAFMKLGDIKGEVRQLPPETECRATMDGQYQCKSPKAAAPLMMKCDKSVRLPQVVKLAEVAKKYPDGCGLLDGLEATDAKGWIVSSDNTEEKTGKTQSHPQLYLGGNHHEHNGMKPPGGGVMATSLESVT